FRQLSQPPAQERVEELDSRGTALHLWTRVRPIARGALLCPEHIVRHLIEEPERVRMISDDLGNRCAEIKEATRAGQAHALQLLAPVAVGNEDNVVVAGEAADTLLDEANAGPEGAQQGGIILRFHEEVRLRVVERAAHQKLRDLDVEKMPPALP